VTLSVLPIFVSFVFKSPPQLPLKIVTNPPLVKAINFAVFGLLKLNKHPNFIQDE